MMISAVGTIPVISTYWHISAESIVEITKNILV